MKKFLSPMRFLFVALLTVVLSQSSVMAADGTGTAAASGLSAIQVIGAFAFLVGVILIPLVKSNKPSINK